MSHSSTPPMGHWAKEDKLRLYIQGFMNNALLLCSVCETGGRKGSTHAQSSQGGTRTQAKEKRKKDCGKACWTLWRSPVRP